MRLGRFGAVLASACALAACLAGCVDCPYPGQCQESGQPGQKTAQNDMVCIRDAQTGSHIVQTHCYPRAEVEERRAKDRAAMERVQVTSNRPGHEQIGNASP